MTPEGAEAWKGNIYEEIPVTFDTEGFCGYKCTPHFGLGMVGLVQAGEDAAPPDLAAVKLPGKEKASMTELVEQAGEAPAI
jgi:hypothetical protein